eukprot:Hpha_TRINITY_DN10459_c0_g1::TRINITY_DN10459_c0_g1_i1::g.193265::m.193265
MGCCTSNSGEGGGTPGRTPVVLAVPKKPEPDPCTTQETVTTRTWTAKSPTRTGGVVDEASPWGSLAGDFNEPAVYNSLASRASSLSREREDILRELRELDATPPRAPPEVNVADAEWEFSGSLFVSDVQFDRCQTGFATLQARAGDDIALMCQSPVWRVQVESFVRGGRGELQVGFRIVAASRSEGCEWRDAGATALSQRVADCRGIRSCLGLPARLDHSQCELGEIKRIRKVPSILLVTPLRTREPAQTSSGELRTLESEDQDTVTLEDTASAVSELHDSDAVSILSGTCTSASPSTGAVNVQWMSPPGPVPLSGVPLGSYPPKGGVESGNPVLSASSSPSVSATFVSAEDLLSADGKGGGLLFNGTPRAPRSSRVQFVSPEEAGSDSLSAASPPRGRHSQVGANPIPSLFG